MIISLDIDSINESSPILTYISVNWCFFELGLLFKRMTVFPSERMRFREIVYLYWYKTMKCDVKYRIRNASFISGDDKHEYFPVKLRSGTSAVIKTLHSTVLFSNSEVDVSWHLVSGTDGLLWMCVSITLLRFKQTKLQSFTSGQKQACLARSRCSVCDLAVNRRTLGGDRVSSRCGGRCRMLRMQRVMNCAYFGTQALRSCSLFRALLCVWCVCVSGGQIHTCF